MEKNTISVWKATQNPGIFLGIVLIIYTLILYFFDLTFHKWLGYVSYLIIIVGIFLGIKTYRDNFLGGVISYGHSLGAGVLISLYSSVITAIFAYLLYKFIDPDLTKKMLSVVEETLLAKGIPEEQIEMALKIQEKMITPFITSISTLFGGVLIGFIISLIISIFTKKEGDPFTQDMAGVEYLPESKE